MTYFHHFFQTIPGVLALNLFYSAWPNSLSKSPPNVFWLSWSKIICVDTGHLHILYTAILPLTDKKIPSEMEVAPRYNCWKLLTLLILLTLFDTVRHCWLDLKWVVISYKFVLFQFSSRKDQLRAEMPFGKWLSHGCLGVFSNWLSKRVSKSIF